MPAIEVAHAANGRLTYLIHDTPQALPPVRRRDLVAAWDDARSAALRRESAPRRAFRFARPGGDTTDLALSDPDASVWAGAVDRTLGVGNPYGADLDPGLWRLAAEAKLTEEGRFDAMAFRAALTPLAGPTMPIKDAVP